MAAEPDAYRILQVDPAAEELVVRAAYHALARRYHPDGAAPDATRMREINRAFEQLADSEARRRYDERRTRAFSIGGSVSSTTTAPAAPRSATAPSVLDFGRYTGWSLSDLLHHDPDYLRWLVRHSSGIRYRTAIKQLLPGEEIDRRASVVSY